MESDEQRLRLWMIEAQAGDSRSYELLLQDLAKLSRSYVLKRLHRKSEAEDIVQEVLMAVHLARKSYLPQRPFLPWFFAIARYRMIDSMRRQMLVSRSEVQVETMPDVAAQELEDASLGDQLESAIKDLPEKQKEVVMLMKVSGLSVKDTSQRTGLSESAVKVAAHRAYKALRQALGRVRS